MILCHLKILKALTQFCYASAYGENCVNLLENFFIIPFYALYYSDFGNGENFLGILSLEFF